MWVFTLVLASFCITSSLACNGCKLESLEVKSCSEESKELYDVQCETFDLTEQCTVNSTCTQRLKIDIKSAKLTVEGKVGDMPISYTNDKICEELENKNVNGHDISGLNYYPIPASCQATGMQESITKSIKLREDAINNLPKAKGHIDLKVEFQNINGDESKKICFEINSNLECKERTREPKA